jgi:hypothetical protein
VSCFPPSSWLLKLLFVLSLLEILYQVPPRWCSPELLVALVQLPRICSEVAPRQTPGLFTGNKFNSCAGLTAVYNYIYTAATVLHCHPVLDDFTEDVLFTNIRLHIAGRCRGEV